MNHRNNEQNTGKKNMMPKKGLLVAGGILLAAAAIAGLVWGQFSIPLGCAFALFGILFLAMRPDLDNPAYNIFSKVGFALAIIIGCVLLCKGLTAGVNVQDDRNYAQELGVTADQVLAMRDSEGTKYVVIKDGELTRRYLPEEYLAQTPDEIGGVVIIRTVSSRVGYYTNGGNAYRTNHEISLMSLKTGETLRSTTLYGENPPEHATSHVFDFDKDRYGEPSSDEKIRKNCVSLVENEENEQARRGRVTLMTEEEMVEFVHEAITETKREDGWSDIDDVTEALAEADPDFSITDYGHEGLFLYFKADARYEVKTPDYSDPIQAVMGSYYVRWAGN